MPAVTGRRVPGGELVAQFAVLAGHLGDAVELLAVARRVAGQLLQPVPEGAQVALDVGQPRRAGTGDEPRAGQLGELVPGVHKGR